MEKTQKIISEIYDKQSGKLIKRTVITEKTIINPNKIDDIGYNQEEQIDVLHNIQDDYLKEMANVMTEEKYCLKCGSKAYKCGSLESDFHSVYTDHRIKISGLKCTDKQCNWEHRKTIYGEYGSKMHPDLVKKQVEKASTKSYWQSQAELDLESGRVRKVNNNLSLKNTVSKVGQILNSIHTDHTNVNCTEMAETLVVQIDVGYVKDCNPKLNSFEVLLAQVYNPKNHKQGYIQDNGNRVSGEIIDKTCVASAYKDRGKTIKNMLLFAAKKQGISNQTDVVALCDGAENCWNTAKTLKPYCKSMNYILDWYHIRQKFETLEKRVDDPHLSELQSIKWQIWHGKSDEALKRLNLLYVHTSKNDYTDKVHELFKYLTNNQEYLINYESRKSDNLPFTSSIIESAVETIINDRHKKKHKAQWTREGAHNVLQIRTSRASKDWNTEWAIVKERYYTSRYRGMTINGTKSYAKHMLLSGKARYL